jgi:hypothetical protein
MPADLAEDLERIERKRTFQLGDAAQLPATKREKAAVARWIEIDKRRYHARAAGEPFSYTPAERQLKQRLLKAGLIVVKPQPKLSQRKRRKLDEEDLLRAAKHFAAAGDVGAIQHVEAVEQHRHAEVWQRKMRMLRRQEPKVLLEALRDAMAARGIRRPLAALWREFTEGWESASADSRQALTDDVLTWAKHADRHAKHAHHATRRTRMREGAARANANTGILRPHLAAGDNQGCAGEGQGERKACGR